jgi:flagellar biosynthesis chaperone FliJ
VLRSQFIPSLKKNVNSKVEQGIIVKNYSGKMEKKIHQLNETITKLQSSLLTRNTENQTLQKKLQKSRG